MKNNRYEIGDTLPEGKEVGDIFSLETEGIVAPIREPKVKLRSRQELENQLDDALKRIEVLEG